MISFENTVAALNYSAFIYLASCFAFILAMARAGVSGEGILRKLGALCVVVGFILHTYGLAGRWYLGGIDRPPWTNLYESLVFFAWGVVLFQVYIQRKWKMPILGAVSMPLVFLLMGMAVLTPNKEIEPLIPALQSYWLKIHVIFGMLAYAGFTIAGCLAFFHLIRSGTSMSKIGAGLSFVIVLNLFLAGGNEFFDTGKFYMARTVVKTDEQGNTIRMKDRYQEYENGPVVTRMEEVPAANIPFVLTLLAYLSSGFLMAQRGFSRKKPEADSPNDVDALSARLFNFATLSFVGFFAWVGYQMNLKESLTLYSNPYLTLLLMMTFFFVVFYLIARYRYQGVVNSLPSAERLDELGYKNILFAFPFQTLLLITGAVWAYYAWGRSWGWDPKEVGALITWFAYLIYLHGKLLLHWSPRVLSVLSIISFIILIFAFLGVNLVLSGLHTYGSA